MREKATKGKPTKKSGGKRKARPAKGRAKRTAAQRALTARGRAKAKKSRAKSQPAKPAGKSAGAGKGKSGKKVGKKSRKQAGSGKASVKRGGARASPVSRRQANGRLPAGAVAAVSSATRAVARAIKGTARRLVRAAGLSHPPRANRSAHRRGRMAPRSSASAAARRVRSSKRGRLRVPGVVINSRTAPRQGEILTRQAVAFLAELHRTFDARRRALLRPQTDRDAGEADALGGAEWTVAPVPADTVGRGSEIADAADRKALVMALNFGASDCLADFAGADPLAWPDVVAGQVNLKDLWGGKIDFADPETGAPHAVGETSSLLIMRPRGWHVTEVHVLIDAAPISAALFDFGLYFFHNARAQIAKGAAPHFQLSKLASQAEARLWNDVFVFAREKLDIPAGAITATVLIETLPAFEVTC
jgi:hypothetical protein